MGTTRDGKNMKRSIPKKAHTTVTLLAVAVLSAMILTGCAASGNAEGTATINGNSQTVTTKLDPNTYSPIVVKKGIPVTWNLSASPENLTSCNNAILIPALGIQKPLAAGDNIIEFTPQETGTISYTCWMGMIPGQITVVDEL